MSHKHRKPTLSSPLILLTIFAIATLLFAWLLVRLFHSAQSNIISEIKIEVARVERSLTDKLEHTGAMLRNINHQILKNPLSKTHIKNILSAHQGSPHTSKNFPWTLFSWIDKEYLLTVDAEYGILKNPIDISIKDYCYPLERNPGKLQLGSKTIGTTSRKWIIPGGIGMTDENNRFIGATVIGLDLKILSKNLYRAIQNPDVNFKLFSKNGINLINGDPRKARIYANDDSTTNIELEKVINEVNTSSDKRFSDISFLGNSRAIFAKTVGDYPYIIIAQYRTDSILKELINVTLSRLNEIFSILFSFAVLIFLIYREVKQTKNIFRMKLAADRANNSKTEFLTKVTHEFKNFIFGIHGCAEIIRDDLRKTSEALKKENNSKNLHYLRDLETDLEMANNIAETSHDLDLFINELMELTALKEEDLEIHASLSPLNLGDLVKDLASQLKRRAKNSEVILVMDIDQNLHELSNLDPKRVKQIVSGLTSNSIKYSKKNTVVMVSIKNITDEEELKRLHKIYGLKKSEAVEILITDQNSHINNLEIASSLHSIKNLKKFDHFLTKLPAIKLLIEKQGGIFEVRSDKQNGNETRIIF